MALQKQVITIPLADGLDTKTDEFQVMAGRAIELENARFYKVGKLQKRFGFEPLESSTEDGDLSDLDIKAVVADDNLINVITDEGVLALSEGSSKWEQLSEMKECIKLRTEFVSKSAYNHFNPDLDFMESTGLAACIYREQLENNALTANPAEYVTVVLEDINTGVKKIRKIDVKNTTSYKTSAQKVMIVLDSGVIKIHAFYISTSSNALVHHVIDENLEDISKTTLEASYTGKMDVCRDASNIYFFIMNSTALKCRRITLGGTVALTNTITTTNSLGVDGTSGFKMGFSIAQDTTRVHVFFLKNTGTVRIVGVGVLKTTLAVSITETTSSSDWPNLRDLSIVMNGSQVVIATLEAAATSLARCRLNKFVVTWAASYTFTEPSILDGVERAVILSRPFIIDSVAYVIAKCPESDQPTGLIYSLDSQKFPAMFSPFGLSEDRLAANGIHATGTCNAIVYGTKVISLIEKSYGVNTNSITTFDFNASIAISKLILDFGMDLTSGTKSKLGETNYYTNGSTFSLDGRGGYESGFFLRPKIDAVASNTSGGATPGVASKNFSYIAVYNFFNGKGELERSIPSPAMSIATAAGTTYVQVTVRSLPGSYKNQYFYDPVGVSFTQKYVTEVVLYRTQDNGSTYYRVSSAPSSQFLDTILADASADSAILDNEILYSTGGVLENDSTPNAKFSTAGGNRLFLGGLEEEDEIAYSKKQLYGEAVAFSDFFRIRISSGTHSDKSKMSALGYLDGKLIIFRANSIYYIAGDGPLETGTQNTFTEPEVISSDTGCDQPRSVVNTPQGILFKSRKGIYLLDRSLQVGYVGAEAEAYNDEGIVASIVSDKFNEAKFYTDAGNCLTYNYLFSKWSVAKNQTLIDADIWAGDPVQVMDGIVCQESESSFEDNSENYGMMVKTPWLKLGGLQDFGRIWTASVLGKFKSAHTLRITAYYDYATDYSEVFDISPSLSDSQYQYICHLVKQKCEAVQFVIQDISQSGTGESMELTALTLEIGIKKGSMKLPATRKY